MDTHKHKPISQHAKNVMHVMNIDQNS